MAHFESLNVAILADAENIFKPIHLEKTVEGVSSKSVCDTICTLPDLEHVVNAWKYDNATGVCKCGWLTSLTCNWETEAVLDSSQVTVHIELSKTLSCGTFSQTL